MNRLLERAPSARGRWAAALVFLALAVGPPLARSSPVFSSFSSYNSTDGAVTETSWNDTASSVSAVVQVIDPRGLDLAGPAPMAPTPGTAVLWHLDETAGTTAADASGQGATGTLTGATHVASEYGFGLQINGGYASASLAGAPVVRTAEIWFHLSGGNRTGTLVALSDGANEIDLAVITGGYLEAASWQASGSVLSSFQTGSAYNDGNYHFAALVVSTAGASIYVDGFLAAASSSFSNPIAATQLRVGNDFGLAAQQATFTRNTIVDEFRASTALETASDIQDDRQGTPFYVQFSTNGGAAFTTVLSTAEPAPYFVFPGTTGVFGSSLTVFGLPAVQSTTTATGSGGTNQVRFFAHSSLALSSAVVSPAFTVLVDTTPSPAVTNLAVSTVGTAGSVNLTWTAPSSGGLSPLLDFLIESSTSVATVYDPADAQVTIATSGVSAGQALGSPVAGLPPGTTVFFRLYSQDATGHISPLSNGATSAVRPVPPSAPFAFTPVFKSSLTVQWTDVVNGPGTQYQVQASTAANFTGTIFVSTVASGTGVVVSTLAADTTYFFQIEALFAGLPSTFTSAGAAATLASTPIAASFQPVNFSSVTVRWSSGGNSSGYLLEASTSSLFSPIAGSSATPSLGQTTMTVSGLASGTTYFFRVGSLNPIGLPNYVVVGSTRTAGVTAPGQASPTFLNVQKGSVTAEWLDFNVPLKPPYQLDASTASDFSGTRFSSTTALTSATIQGLAINTTYFFRAFANVGASSTVPTALGSTSTLAVPIGVSTPAFSSVFQSSLTISFTSGTFSSGFNPAGTRYLLQASTDPAFTVLEASSQTLSLSATFGGLFAGSTHYIRAAALNSNNVLSAFSVLGATRTALSSPGLNLPSFAAVFVSSLSVQWSSGTAPAFDISGTLFTLQLSSSPTFAFISAASGTLNTSAAFTGLLANTSYFARVEAFATGLATTPFVSLGSTATLALPPTAPAFQGVFLSSLTVAWTNAGGSSGFALQASTAADFSGGVLVATTSNAAATSLALPGLAPNTLYFARVGSFNQAFNLDFASAGSTVSAAAAPNVSPSVPPGTPSGFSIFTFNDLNGFGPGGVGSYLAAWDQSVTHAFTGTEASWSSGDLAEESTVMGNWYLHLLSLNSAGSRASSVNIGPFVYVSSMVAGSAFRSYNSTGAALPEAFWNDLASPVTAQLTVQAGGGLNLNGPAPLAPEAAVVGLWHLDEGGGTTSFDSSDQNNDGIWGGAPVRVTGKFGTALQFTGGAQAISGTIEPAQTVGTVELWFQATANNAVGSLFSLLSAGGDEVELSLFRAAGSPNLRGSSFDNASGIVSAITTAGYSTLAWHHAALTMDAGTGGILYLDGVQAGTLTSFKGPYVMSSFIMGDDFGFADNRGPLNRAIIDEVRISTVVLTPAQILRDVQVGNPFYARFSSDGGGTFATVTSTAAGVAPYVVLSGTQGATGTQAVKVLNLPLASSSVGDIGGLGDNQVLFFLSNTAGSLSEFGPYTVLSDTAPPLAVADLAASTIPPAGSARLAWTAPLDRGVSGIGAYLIQSSTNSGVVFSTAAAQVVLSTSGVSAGSPQSANVAGLGVGATNFIALFSRDRAGNVSPVSNTAAVAVPAAPPQVSTPAFTFVGFTSATVQWSSGSAALGFNVAGTSYAVQISSNASFAAFDASQTVSGLQATFTALAAGTTYFVQAAAFSPNGALTPFNLLGSTRTAAAPPGAVSPAFVSVATSAIAAQWTANGDPAGTTYTLQASTAGAFTGTLLTTSTFGTSAPVSGLTDDTTYFFRARAAVGTQTSTFTVLGATSTLAKAPLSLSSTFTAVNFTSATVRWSSGGASQGYLLAASTASDFSGTVLTSATASVLQTTLTVTGLNSGTTYFFEAGALNWNGVPDFTALGSTLTKGVVSPVPSSPVFTMVGVSSASAAWKDLNSPLANSYRLDASTDPAFGVVNASSSTVLTTATVQGLSINTTYYFRALAFIGVSTSAPGSLGSTATLAVPVSTVSPAFTVIQASSFTLQYASGTTGSFNPAGTSFLVQASTDPAFASVGASTSTSALSALFTGLVPGATYFTRGAAVNWNGIPSAFAALGSTSTLLADPGLVSPAFTAVFTSSLAVQWASGTALTAFDPAGTQYLVQVSSSPTFAFGLVSSTTLNLSATVSGLLGDTTYFARVQAQNTVRQSNFLSLGSTATLAAAPTAAGFSAVFQTSATVSWTNAGPSQGFQLDVSTDATFAAAVAFSSTTSGAATSLTVGGLLTDGTYFARIGSFSPGGGLNEAAAGSSVTLPADPGIFDGVSTGTPSSNNNFVFFSSADFGLGGVDYYQYAFDQSLTHVFTGSEPVWSTGTIIQSATQQGFWYFHAKAFNASGKAVAPRDFGPFYFFAAPASFILFRTLNSTGGPVSEGAWNDLSASVTAQLTVQAPRGINLAFPGPQALDPATAGLWHLDEQSGTTAFDSSPASNDGTLISVSTHVAGRFGSALSFNGSTQYVQGSIAGSVVRTFAAWFLITNTTARRGTLFSVTDSAGDEIILSMNRNVLTAAFNSVVPASQGAFSATTGSNDGQWHQAILTLTPPATAALYVDGAFKGQSTAFKTAFAPTQFRFARDFGGTGNGTAGFFPGELDELKFSTAAVDVPAALAMYQGAPFYVRFSTTTGASFQTVTSTVPSPTVPYVVISATQGATGPSTFTVFNMPLVHTQNFSTGAAASNQVLFQAGDLSGEVAGGPFGVLVDTVIPGPTADLAAQPGTVDGQVVLGWSAPGDDGAQLTNSLGSYDVRFSTTGAIASTAAFVAASSATQSLVPLSPGSLQSLAVNGLTTGTTYFFALRAKDKAGNLSTLSNSTSSLPFRRKNILINEVFPATSPAANQWIELYNLDATSVTLTGWTLTYHQGALGGPGTDTVVWTGLSTDTMAVSGFLTAVPSSLLNAAASHAVILKDPGSQTISAVQWPVLAAGRSLARVTDGNPSSLEVDPTPTKGAANASTGTIKINEVFYNALASQFVELYNTTNTATLTNWTLRNKNGVLFKFTKKISTQTFAGFDPATLDNVGTSFTAAFGASGLTAAGDALVLENPQGQAVDRVTWQSGANFVYLSSMSALASYATPAPASVPAGSSIGRQPSDGSDTGVNSTDFIPFAAPSLGASNSTGVTASSNTLVYPTATTYIPRTFKLDLMIGQNSSAGPTDNVVFVNTGGTADPHSPHFFSLASLGFNLASGLEQTALLVGATVQDVDGFSLVNGAVYKVMLNTDTGTGRAPQLAVNSVTYDASQATAAVAAKPPLNANAGFPSELAKVTVISGSPSGANGVNLTKVGLTFLNGTNSSPLTNAQLQALLSRLDVFAASGADPGTGLFYAALDTVAVVSLTSPSFSLNGAGFMSLSIATSPFTFVVAGGSRTYYIVGTWTPGAASAVPNSLIVSADPTNGMQVQDGPTAVLQALASTPTVTSASETVVAAQAVPALTTWPRDLGGTAAGVENLPSLGFDTPQTGFLGSNNGVLTALNKDGTVKWTFSSGSAIHSSPIADVDTTTLKNVIYFANDAGQVIKLRDDGTFATQLWSKAVGGPLQSSPVEVINSSGTFIYIGNPLGQVVKLNAADGSNVSGWSFSPSITGAIVSVPYVDEFTAGVKALWVSSQGGAVYRLQTADGTVTSQFATGGAITGSPFLWAGLANALRNTNDMYVASNDGKIYARNSTNLSSLPASWADFNPTSVGDPAGAFNATPFFNFSESPVALYVGCDNGFVYKLNASTGALIWKFKTRGPVRGNPVVVPASFSGAAQDYAYFGSLDGYLYAVQATGAGAGTLKAGFPVFTGAPIRSSPVFDSDINAIVIGSNDGKAYAVTAAP